MTVITCDHGYFLTDCALCQKNPGECDYGSCTETATNVVHGRPMCRRHAMHGLHSTETRVSPAPGYNDRALATARRVDPRYKTYEELEVSVNAFCAEGDKS